MIPRAPQFSNDDVAEKAENDPWEARDDFEGEVSADDMADTAAAYAQAAGEASDAGDIAELATDAARDSGSLDTDDIVDGADRITTTADGLQGNGEEIDSVVRTLVRTMNSALSCMEEIDDHISDIELECDDARFDMISEWNGWQEALREAVSGDFAGSRYTLIPVNNGSRVSYAHPYSANGVLVYYFPEEMVSEIENRYIEVAADKADDGYEEISDSIESYRHKALMNASLLIDSGYDVTSGALDLWINNEMAEYAARGLSNELNEADPNGYYLGLYTNVLGAISEGVHGGDKPEMRARERDYLLTLFNTLDSHDLRKLGGIDGPDGISGVKSNVADGILMLMNPEIGGIAPLSAPDSIADFVYNIPRQATSNELSQYDVLAFNDFSRLMAEAGGEDSKVTPGSIFAQDLAKAALYTSDAGIRLGEYVSSGMLAAAAHNHGAAAEILGDPDYAHRAVRAAWADYEGVSEFVKNGTTVPDSVGHNEPEARKYYEAAYNVLAKTGERGDSLFADPVGDGWENYHEALSDVAINHLDFITINNDSDEFFSVDNDFTRRNLFGASYSHHFEFSEQTKDGIFSALLSGEESSDYWRAGVANWQLETAARAFEDEASGEHAPEGTGNTEFRERIRNIAEIEGYMSKSERGLIFEDAGAFSRSVSMANTVLDFAGNYQTVPPHVQAGLGVADAVSDIAVAYSEAEVESIDRADALGGDVPVRVIIARGATLGEENEILESENSAFSDKEAEAQRILDEFDGSMVGDIRTWYDGARGV